MGLDFALAGTGRDRASVVSLSVDDHWALMSLARENELTALLRFQDFYDLHRIAWSSLEPIVSDLEQLASATGPDSRQTGAAAALHELVSTAAEGHINLIVIPD